MLLGNGLAGVGQYALKIPATQTIRSFEEICDGKWDHLPESAFMYVGVVEQAEEAAKKMAAAVGS